VPPPQPLKLPEDYAVQFTVWIPDDVPR